jgi:putative endonuclease
VSFLRRQESRRELDADPCINDIKYTCHACESRHPEENWVLPHAQMIKTNGSFLRRQESIIMKQSYVYIIASKKNGTLYIGVTSDLKRRIYEHKNKLAEGFSKRYDISLLVYFEIYDDIRLAILREKRLKAWKRDWKIRLIEEQNPEWNDLYFELR